jgi:pyruvate formate lyase activating enzyme
MSLLQIKGFVETSLCDWDGSIASVIFLPGCNLRCPFCQNRDLVLDPENLPTVGLDVVSGYLRAHSSWIDGVVITGGEPTLWEDLPALARQMKEMGFGVKLDTNGTLPAKISELIEGGLVDYIAMDLKAPLDDRYARAAGCEVDVDRIRRSIDIVSGFGDAYEFRTTLVPGLVGETEVDLMARAIEGARCYVLQRFVPENSLDKSLHGVVPYDDSFVARLLETAGKHVESCFYRGKIGVGLA